MRSGFRRTLRRAIGPLALLGLWQLGSATGFIPERTLAGPSKVASTAGDLISSGQLLEHLQVSLVRVAWGLLIGITAGTVLALIAGLSKLGEDLVDAPLQMLRTLPVLALVPLFILWFGIGEQAK